MKRYVLALDQGTTSSRAVLYDGDGRVRGAGQLEHPQSFPQPGRVEHDPDAIFRTTRTAARAALKAAGARPEEIAAIGITNQRETVVAWDRTDGRPVHPAIVWQCRRTAEACAKLRRAGREATVRRKTGLRLDPYFSATKAAWILKHVPEARRLAAADRLAFGTIDAWLIWKLTSGRVHATDASNASRTLLYDLKTGDYDSALLELFGVPAATLPEIVDSSAVIAECDGSFLGAPIPIAGVAGDQQAALYGQRCFGPGAMKNTYGTGAFLLMNAGLKPPVPRGGLLATVAWRKGGATTFALEGGVFVAGAAVQWLRDGLGVVKRAADTRALAESLQANEGVYFVPAFVGLGTPHWDPDARGAIVGLTRGSGRAHLARAALEAIAYQTRDLVEAMTAGARIKPKELRVDGGAAANDFLCRFQADLLGLPVVRPEVVETTSLGAAYLAGLAVGFWKDERALAALPSADRRFEPTMKRSERERLYAGWLEAVDRTRTRR